MFGRFRPFAPRARVAIVAIVLTFVLVSTASAALSIWSTGKSQNQAAVLEIAARQRTLAERYVQELLLVQSGSVADPRHTGSILAASARVLLDGGVAPAVEGDDDDVAIGPATDPEVRAELRQEQRLVFDLTSSGDALLDGKPVSTVHLTARERISTRDPLERLRVLAALTSNVALNTARTMRREDRRQRPEVDQPAGRARRGRDRHLAAPRVGADRCDAAPDGALPESRHLLHRPRAGAGGRRLPLRERLRHPAGGTPAERSARPRAGRVRARRRPGSALTGAAQRRRGDRGLPDAQRGRGLAPPRGARHRPPSRPACARRGHQRPRHHRPGEARARADVCRLSATRSPPSSWRRSRWRTRKRLRTTSSSARWSR